MDQPIIKHTSCEQRHNGIARRSVLKGVVAASIVAGAGCEVRDVGSIIEIDYLKQDAIGLADLVRKGKVSAGELLEEAIIRAVKQNARLNFMA